MIDRQPRGAPQEGPAQVRLCALLTSFNRRELTLKCLRALAASEGVPNVELHAVLVDDGSTDGTAQAVREAFDWVEVVEGDGSLFWCRGMHLAFDTASRAGFDHYLWLNDDTTLLPDALARLLECAAEMRQASDAPFMVVGSTIDPHTGALSYGGERRASRWAMLRMSPLAPTSRAQRCDSMNGNIVLVPAQTAQRVGNLEPSFEHAMGDSDYALRARRLGVAIWLAPHVHGQCANNPVAGSHADESLPLAQRWKRMLSRKGLPWRSWLTFTRRHTGVMWPLYFVWPYAKLVVSCCFGSRARRAVPR